MYYKHFSGRDFGVEMEYLLRKYVYINGRKKEYNDYLRTHNMEGNNTNLDYESIKFKSKENVSMLTLSIATVTTGLAIKSECRKWGEGILAWSLDGAVDFQSKI